jgi:NAD(P)-dependent dehydrogenase (short-subunit alcohol dehydrogenase family)
VPLLPQLRRQQYGKIVNISSRAALKGTGSRIHYVVGAVALFAVPTATPSPARRSSFSVFRIQINVVRP